MVEDKKPRTRTLYVREEDAEVWEKARELAGESLSQLVTTFLRNFVAEKEAAAGGFYRIVLRYRTGYVPYAKAFHGRWLISPEKPFRMENSQFKYALALTAKNNIATFSFTGSPNAEGTYDWGNLQVFESFEAARQKTPSPLIATAMEKLGVEVEELDI